MNEPTTHELLAQHATLLNQLGDDHPDVAAFVNRHSDNRKFVQLAAVAATLKKAFAQTKVTRCNWCDDPLNPDPKHHPGGQIEHIN